MIVEDDRAVGVRLSDGGELRADIVVSACDGYTTTMKFLKGAYLGEDYRKLYTETIHEPGMVFSRLLHPLPRPLPPLPRRRPLHDAPDRRDPGGRADRHPAPQHQRPVPQLPLPRTVSGRHHRRLRHLLLRHRPLARPGRGARTGHPHPRRPGAAHPARPPRARLLRGETAGPRGARRLPGTAPPRPAGGDRRPGRLQPPHPGPLHRQLRRDRARLAAVRGERGEARRAGQEARPRPPGLRDFYQSGVWATTGGLIRAAAAGRHVMQFVCRDDGKPFTASVDLTAPPPTHRVIPVPVRPTAPTERKS